MSLSLAVSLDFFWKGLSLLQPRIHRLSERRTPPVRIYSDAEWTVDEESHSISKGLGGILWVDEFVRAAAVEAPDELVGALSTRKTQIIPLELMAAAGMLYKERLKGRDVLFFIDNQSVCCALTKGSSRSCSELRGPSLCWSATSPRGGLWVEIPD